LTGNNDPSFYVLTLKIEKSELRYFESYAKN
jgi:hypothetical protein